MIASSPRRIAASGLHHLVMALLALVVLLPIIWLVVSSIRPTDRIFVSVADFEWRIFLPDSATFEHYRALWHTGFPRAVLNSVIVSFGTVAFGVLVNALAGFAFAVFRFPGRDVLFVCVLASFMMPFEAIVIPLYVLVRWLDWLNTYRALILPEVASGIVIFLFRQFFKAIPVELFEAARVDGASWLGIFFKIAMPLAWPTVATGALMLFLVQWEAFFWPLTAASRPEITVVQVEIARNINFEQADWPSLFSMTTVAIVLAAIPFGFLQRFYIRTMLGTGLK